MNDNETFSGLGSKVYIFEKGGEFVGDMTKYMKRATVIDIKKKPKRRPDGGYPVTLEMQLPPEMSRELYYNRVWSFYMHAYYSGHFSRRRFTRLRKWYNRQRRKPNLRYIGIEPFNIVAQRAIRVITGIDH